MYCSSQIKAEYNINLISGLFVCVAKKCNIK